jgi:hypothetical protein
MTFLYQKSRVKRLNSNVKERRRTIVLKNESYHIESKHYKREYDKTTKRSTKMECFEREFEYHDAEIIQRVIFMSMSSQRDAPMWIIRMGNEKVKDTLPENISQLDAVREIPQNESNTPDTRVNSIT